MEATKFDCCTTSSKEKSPVSAASVPETLLQLPHFHRCGRSSWCTGSRRPCRGGCNQPPAAPSPERMVWRVLCHRGAGNLPPGDPPLTGAGATQTGPLHSCPLLAPCETRALHVALGGLLAKAGRLPRGTTMSANGRQPACKSLCDAWESIIDDILSIPLRLSSTAVRLLRRACLCATPVTPGSPAWERCSLTSDGSKVSYEQLKNDCWNCLLLALYVQLLYSRCTADVQ
eukprot:365491-Chlamydomonas_euryale.AAC.3